MIGMFTILLLTILQFSAGFGALTLLRIRLRPLLFISLALLVGIASFSIVPFMLQLFFIPLRFATVFLFLVLITIALNIKCRQGIRELKIEWRQSPVNIKIYEVPFIIVM